MPPRGYSGPENPMRVGSRFPKLRLRLFQTHSMDQPNIWIHRELTDRIRQQIATRPVTLLISTCQIGKISLLKNILPDAPYISLDRLALAAEAESNPMEFLARFPQQVIIEEVRYAPSLFRSLKILVDENRLVNREQPMTSPVA